MWHLLTGRASPPRSVVVAEQARFRPLGVGRLGTRGWAQVHHERIATHLIPGVQAFTAKLNAIAHSLEQAGMSSVQATKQAYAAIYRQLIQQAQTLAYLDTLFVFACFAALMVPLVLLTKGVRGRAAASH